MSRESLRTCAMGMMYIAIYVFAAKVLAIPYLLLAGPGDPPTLFVYLLPFIAVLVRWRAGIGAEVDDEATGVVWEMDPVSPHYYLSVLVYLTMPIWLNFVSGVFAAAGLHSMSVWIFDWRYSALWVVPLTWCLITLGWEYLRPLEYQDDYNDKPRANYPH